MITTNQFGSFGAKFSVIRTPSFNIRITTAKKGLLSGLSTIVWDDDGGSPPPPVMNINYENHFPKDYRYIAHDNLTEELNKLGEDGHDLPSALLSAAKTLKNKDLLKSFSII